MTEKADSGHLHIVDVSGGAASAVALFRVVERFGRENVLARFADTKTEHPDLYRFLSDLEKVVGLPIVRLQDGRTTWDVFSELRMWTSPTNGGCLASDRLKKRVLREHLDSLNCTPDSATIYVGFDASEEDRCERLRKAAHPWKVDFPLIWRPWLLRCDQESFLRARGVEPCSMYERGYSHANCGGACVLAGIGQWAMVLADYPELFAKAEQHEQDMMEHMKTSGRAIQSILRSRVGGASTNFTLRELREKAEAGQLTNVDGNRETSCSCVGLLFDFDEQ